MYREPALYNIIRRFYTVFTNIRRSGSPYTKINVENKISNTSDVTYIRIYNEPGSDYQYFV